MDKITVSVGSIVSGNSGQTNNSMREVEFTGEELASATQHGINDRGGITDTRGVTETLYKTDDGRLVVHIEDWSRWQGEPTIARLHAITEEDLTVGGEYEGLGVEAGYGRPLTLDEALV